MTKERENSKVLESKTEQIARDSKYREIETSREENSKTDPESLITNKISSRKGSRKQDKIQKTQSLKKLFF